MFGYFVRRVDKRFQLERSLGLIEEPQADAVARLERLFNTASEPEDLDGPASPSTSTSDASSTPDSSTTDTGANAAPGKKKKDSPLRKYIEKFDQATLTDMTRQVVSQLVPPIHHAHVLAKVVGQQATLLYVHTDSSVEVKLLMAEDCGLNHAPRLRCYLDCNALHPKIMHDILSRVM